MACPKCTQYAFVYIKYNPILQGLELGKIKKRCKTVCRESLGSHSVHNNLLCRQTDKNGKIKLTCED
jgi:hypothetical protein